MSRRVMLWAALAALAFAPMFTGAMPLFRGARYLPFAVLLFSIYSFSLGKRPIFKRLTLVILSTFFAVTLGDLAARPFAPYIFQLRLVERFTHPWPPQPHLLRYDANLNLESSTFGDLAAMSRRAELREERRVRFITDSYGFRNEETGPDNRSLDLILLGDSFGAASQTSNESLLSTVIARKYQLVAYNLSVTAHSPLQEYATLVMESDRLGLREGTTVLWLLFTGNDLDELYTADLETRTPTVTTWPQRWFRGYQRFREASPLRRLMSPSDSSNLVIERSFVDGRPLLFFKPYVEQSRRSADEVRAHPNYAHLQTTFTLMRNFAQEKRLRVVVALVPSKEQIYGWVINGRAPWSSSGTPSGFAVVAQELCATNGFKFFDLEPNLSGASLKVFRESGELLWWRDDTHWNVLGQRIAAEAIYENLLRDSLRSR